MVQAAGASVDPRVPKKKIGEQLIEDRIERNDNVSEQLPVDLKLQAVPDPLCVPSVVPEVMEMFSHQGFGPGIANFTSFACKFYPEQESTTGTNATLMGPPCSDKVTQHPLLKANDRFQYGQAGDQKLIPPGYQTPGRLIRRRVDCTSGSMHII
ncbi:hypothetical protein RP20_CCG026361 [Aedes albopictus]|nr:hypothetical protein RP20_CCG026361 [Aedes albopictus]